MASYARQLSVLPDQTRRVLLAAAADPFGDRSLVWRAADRLEIPAAAAAPTSDPAGHAERYHPKRDSIEAHLTIVFAALAVSGWIEAQIGWSIRNSWTCTCRLRKPRLGRRRRNRGDPDRWKSAAAEQIRLLTSQVREARRRAETNVDWHASLGRE